MLWVYLGGSDSDEDCGRQRTRYRAQSTCRSEGRANSRHANQFLLSSKLGQIRSKSRKNGRSKPVQFGRSNLGEVRPNLVELPRNVQIWLDFDRAWPEFSQFRPTLTGTQLKLARIRRCLARFRSCAARFRLNSARNDRSWTQMGQLRPKLADSGPSQADLGSVSANFGPTLHSHDAGAGSGSARPSVQQS